jgi:hypothetical protein
MRRATQVLGIALMAAGLLLTPGSLLRKASVRHLVVVLGRPEAWVAAVGWWLVARQG